MTKLATFVAAAALVALPAVSHAQAMSGMAQDSTHKAMKGMHKGRHKGMKNEMHPELHKAMKALERAKKDLDSAASDYGGHKAEAIKALDEAIKHVQMAEDFDKK